MKNNLKQGTIHLTISSFIFIVTGYFINIWLGRFLGPLVYGSYGVIVSLISFVNILQTSGLTQSAAKYIAEDESLSDEIFKSAFNIQMVATFSIAILFFALSGFLASILHDSSLIQYLQLASLIFPIYGYYALLIDYNNGLHFFKKQALLNILYSLTKIIGIFTLGIFFKLTGVIIGLILASIVPSLYGFYYPKKVKVHFPYKKLILFSLPLIGYIIFSTLLQSVDLYFVKSILSGKEPGYYTASQNIARLIFFGTSAISLVLLPSISNSVRQKLPEKTRVTINTAFRITLLVLIPGALIISAISSELVRLIYSQLYLPSSSSLSILVVGFGFFTVFNILCTILNGSGSPKISFILATVGVIVNVLFCVLLIPIYGLQGAATANLIGNIIVTLIASVFVYKKFKQLIFLGSFIKIIFSSLIIYFLARMIAVPTLLLPLLYVVLFAIYGVLLLLFKEITNDDIKMVSELLPDWLKKRTK